MHDLWYLIFSFRFFFLKEYIKDLKIVYSFNFVHSVGSGPSGCFECTLSSLIFYSKDLCKYLSPGLREWKKSYNLFVVYKLYFLTNKYCDGSFWSSNIFPPTFLLFSLFLCVCGYLFRLTFVIKVVFTHYSVLQCSFSFVKINGILTTIRVLFGLPYNYYVYILTNKTILIKVK